ncbi:MAG TPA: helix-turn-helix domain-containing protein [Nocardioides sp.]|jgi:predicted ArsR family transcriptional regulator|nr:helix-turn-helix domain-containing protein [Nocardioides sp.]
MTDQPLTDPTPAVLGESRGRVLDVLRAIDGPAGVQEIAARVGLHPNTARFHLDGLVDAALAERRAEGEGRPGRPRMVYVATPSDVPAGQRSYRLLAEMLTGLVSDSLPEPAVAAEKAGEAWGRYLAERPAPGQEVDAAEGLRRLNTVLAEVGFDPAPVDDTEHVIPLHHCPFREVAQQHREVVCSLHLGLMRGALSETRAPLAVERLDPFVDPSLCLAHLVPAADQARSPRGR